MDQRFPLEKILCGGNPVLRYFAGFAEYLRDDLLDQRFPLEKILCGGNPLLRYFAGLQNISGTTFWTKGSPLGMEGKTFCVTDLLF